MIPGAAVGLLLEKQIESLLSQNIFLVCGMFLLTAVLLFVADKAMSSANDVTYMRNVKIGIAQVITILPGISSSGATISNSVLLGIDRAKVTRFSFLMVVLLIFGKMVKDLLDGNLTSNTSPLSAMNVGFMVSFFAGIFASTWMIKMVKNSQLKYFSYYCLVVGIAGIAYVYLH